MLNKSFLRVINTNFISISIVRATSIKTGAHGNILYSNTIVLSNNATARAIVFDNDSKSLDNKFRDNRIINTTKT
jgi:hypothetical protein